MQEFKGIPVLGKKVADARNQLVLSQEELAARIKMTKNNLSRIERTEVAGMNRESFRLLAELLGLPLDVMMKRIGAPTDNGTPVKDQDKALRLVEYAREHGFGPGIIDLANRLVKAAASSSERSKAAQDRKKRPKDK